MLGVAGVGFTVIVYVTGVPLHPDNAGVTVMVPEIALEPLLVAVNAGTLPVPLAARPIAVLEFVQVYVAPAGVLLSVLAGTASPSQYVPFAGAVMEGVGFTVTVVV